VAPRDRLRSIGLRRGLRLLAEFGEAALELRTGLGLSRRAVAESIGISESKLARWERGVPPHPDLADAALLMRMLGHDLSVRWFPAGGVLRDTAHARLVAHLVERLPASVPCRAEAPMPSREDLRAWDLLIELAGVRVGVAAETRLRDWQALLRREQQKMRDSGTRRLLLVLLDSNWNRRAVADAGASLRHELPLDGRAIWPSLRRGRDPGGSGLLFLRPSLAKAIVNQPVAVSLRNRPFRRRSAS
jgi:transcriptional regulator with XRE-family HTH domain